MWMFSPLRTCNTRLDVVVIVKLPWYIYQRINLRVLFKFFGVFPCGVCPRALLERCAYVTYDLHTIIYVRAYSNNYYTRYAMYIYTT